MNTLKRVYVEATNKCNLTCSTCIRHVGEVRYGHMRDETFDRILSGLGDFPEKPELFFGGYGEPLAHPKLLEMIDGAKKLGHRVSLIPNGILLTESISQRLTRSVWICFGYRWMGLPQSVIQCPPRRFAATRHRKPDAFANAKISEIWALEMERTTQT